MRLARPSFKVVVGAGFAAVIAVAIWLIVSSGPRVFTVEVTEPALSDRASTGKALFEANCATCHGIKASGTETGPPLIHDFYNPGHHRDAAFFAAAKFGVRQHHWRYGNMPAQPQVSEEQIAAIVQYVREVQIANGIKYRPHQMR